MSDQFDFGKLQDWAESQEPVFIVGPERSGTSMMFRTVVSHPAFCSFSNATVETFCFIRPHELLKKPSPTNYEMRVYLGKQFKAFKQAIKPIAKANRECDEADVPKSFLQKDRRAIWESRRYRDLLRAFFYFSWRNLGRKRLAEKTPAHVRCISEIFDCFPNARVLVCLRNPLEVIASHRKRLAKEIELGKDADDPSLEWLSKSTEHYLGYFDHINRLVGVAQRKFPDALYLVPYNKVTTDSDFLHQVFAFIGADPNSIQPAPGSRATPTPDWDPLLGSMPQENKIDCSAWIDESDIDKVRRTCTGASFGPWLV